MSTIWYYKNVRYDGGIRTGLDVNDERAFQSFVPGEEAEDASLEWFVDVMCVSEILPSEHEAARRWMLEDVSAICDGLEGVAERLSVGLDELSMPFVRSWSDSSSGVNFRIRCSAIRRLPGLDIAARIREVAKGLESELRSLPRAELVAV